MFWLVLVLAPSARGQVENGWKRTQVLSLSKGWNAVFLEVEPGDPAPAKVFAGLPVDKVATLFESPVTNQFVTDSDIDLTKSSGWAIWFEPGLPESFLKSLDEIHGNRAYLVHAKSGCVWNATGSATPTKVAWKPDAYNFVGFPVRSPGGPTFAQFFAGSEAHAGQNIYRLVNGRWKKVIQPATETIRSGEAFWVFCQGGSDYQGPLRVETPTRLGLILGDDSSDVVVRNDCPHPLGVSIEHVPGSTPSVPLSIVVQSFGDRSAPVTLAGVPMSAGPWQQDLPPLEAGGAFAVPFESRLAEMVRPEQASLLKFASDLGTEIWVPVRAFRGDLSD